MTDSIRKAAGSLVARMVLAAVMVVGISLGRAADVPDLIVPTVFADTEAGGGSSTLRDAIRMQEVYSSDAFVNGPVWIYELRFRPSAFYGSAFQTTLQDFEMRLSTTPREPNELFDDFVSNIGPNETIVFNGALDISTDFVGPTSGPKAFDIRIPFDQPFYFDPDDGNLLVDIMNRSGGSADLVDAAGVPANMASRLFQLLGPGVIGKDNGADVIQLVLATPEAVPEFTRQPADQWAVVGDVVTFRTAVRGSFPLGRQWVHDGIALLDETNATLTLVDVGEAQQGNYWIWATNAAGGATSQVASLTLTNWSMAVVPPTFSNLEGGNPSPTLRSARRLQQVYDAELFSGQPLLIHQVRFRPSAAAGRAFETSLTGLTIRMSSTGRDSEQLSPAFEENSGPDASLVFTGAVELASAFVGEAEGPKAFDVVLPLTLPFLYEPGDGNLLVDIMNPLGSTVTFLDMSFDQGDRAARVLSSDPDAFLATQSDAGADVLALMHSNPADVPNLTILRHPQDLTVIEEDDVRMQVVVLGPRPMQYQWQFENQPLSGQTNRYLYLRNVEISQAGQYSVVVSNATETATSNTATLTVNPRPPALILRGPYLQQGGPAGVIVQWRTDVPVRSAVFYGLSSNDLTQVVRTDVPVTEHRVAITGLPSSTRYYYGVGTGTNVLASGPDHHFVTSPMGSAPTRIWVIGDCGTASQGNGAPRTVLEAYLEFTGERGTDVWLMLGDNAYLTGTDAEYQLAVFDVYQPLLRTVPLWSTIGNHETYSADGSGHFAYLDIFSLPENGEVGGHASGTERYYSFDYSNIHFVCLDSETSNKTEEGAMLTWLEEDLSANTQPWLIAFWHSPPYSKGSHDSDYESNLVLMRENALPILERHGVDLVLCGHSHAYERSRPIRGHYGTSDTLEPNMVLDAGNGRVEEDGAYQSMGSGIDDHQGAVYIVAGNAGQVSGGLLNHPIMVSSLNHLGSLVVDVEGGRMDVQFLRETGAVDDWFTVLKEIADDSFRMAGIRVRDGVVTAEWNSVPEAVYQVEAAHNLESPQWTSVSGELTADSTRTTWSGPAQVGSMGKSFYRVRLISPLN